MKNYYDMLGNQSKRQQSAIVRSEEWVGFYLGHLHRRAVPHVTETGLMQNAAQGHSPVGLH